MSKINADLDGQKRLYIIGAGSVGGHIASNLLDYDSSYNISGFFDDDADKHGKDYCGFTVIGPVSDALSLNGASIAVGIAFPKIKMKLISLLKSNKTLKFPALIHNRAWLSEGVTVGSGTVIYPGNSINFGSRIGEFVVMNMNCAIGHHSTIGNYTSLAPGVNLGGHTVLDACVDMGIGSSTIQNVKVGKNSIVGGQAMIVTDIPSESLAKGVPARFTKLLNK